MQHSDKQAFIRIGTGRRCYSRLLTRMPVTQWAPIQEMYRVAERLTAGGFPVDTPVVVVYKATWAERRTVRGTLEEIAEWVHQAAIHKTALILVEAFLGDEYHYSKLYDAGFSHEYRQT